MTSNNDNNHDTPNKQRYSPSAPKETHTILRVFFGKTLTPNKHHRNPTNVQPQRQTKNAAMQAARSSSKSSKASCHRPLDFSHALMQEQKLHKSGDVMPYETMAAMYTP